MIVSWFLVPWCDNPSKWINMVKLFCIEQKQNGCLTVLKEALIYTRDKICM